MTNIWHIQVSSSSFVNFKEDTILSCKLKLGSGVILFRIAQYKDNYMAHVGI